MDEEIERLMVSVRADTSGFARDVAEMPGQLDGGFAESVGRAGRVLAGALVRAIRTGQLGFEDLKRVALAAMAEIAAAAIRSGLAAIIGGGGKGGSGLLGGLLGLLGLPGRATGGPVSPGRPYLVGERGPELFVPTSSGRVETGLRSGGRDIRLSITINAPAGAEPRALEQSTRQVARAVRRALVQLD